MTIGYCFKFNKDVDITKYWMEMKNKKKQRKKKNDSRLERRAQHTVYSWLIRVKVIAASSFVRYASASSAWILLKSDLTTGSPTITD